MKKFFAAVTVCALVVTICGASLAQEAAEGGCSKCNKAKQQEQSETGSSSTTESGSIRQFMLKTIDLRQEMMNMRFGLQRENLSAAPDAAKVAVLTAGIRAIQARINEIRVQSGLTDEGLRDGECFKMDGNCGKSGAPGGCNGMPCGLK